jgi:hypothetical protein
LTDPGCFSERVSSFSATWQKTKQKNTPVSRYTLRVAVAAGARGNSPVCVGLKQSARLIPSASSMLGAEQREIKKPYIQKLFFQPPPRRLLEAFHFAGRASRAAIHKIALETFMYSNAWAVRPVHKLDLHQSPAYFLQVDCHFYRNEDNRPHGYPSLRSKRIQ